MTALIINKGSDLRWSGVWRDKATGAAINLTGYTVALFDAHAFLVGKLTVTITDAVTGAFALAMDWDAAMDVGDLLPFRLRFVSAGGIDTTSPEMRIEIA